MGANQAVYRKSWALQEHFLQCPFLFPNLIPKTHSKIGNYRKLNYSKLMKSFMDWKSSTSPGFTFTLVLIF